MAKQKNGSVENRQQSVRINDRIRLPQLQVVDSNGTNLGILPRAKALSLANEQNLDLVEVSPNSRPPVCRIMDYGKYKYEQGQKDKKNKQNNRINKLKEIKLSPVIDHHDLETKLNMARKFLTSGQKVQFRLQFKKRQIAHKDIGFEVIKKVIEELQGIGSIVKAAKLEGKAITCIIEPKVK